MPLKISDLPDDILSSIIDRVGEKTYVISNSSKTSIVNEPGLNRPYSTTNRKVAEHVAREIGGGAFVCTLREALDYHLFKRK